MEISKNVRAGLEAGIRPIAFIICKRVIQGGSAECLHADISAKGSSCCTYCQPHGETTAFSIDE